MKTGDIVTNKDGKSLLLKTWLPYAGFTIKGKWLCCTDRGITCQLSERELKERGFLGSSDSEVKERSRNMTAKEFTLNEALSPLAMTCAKCGGQMMVYPAPIPTGTGYCPNCSPAWVKSFALFMTNGERSKRGLLPIES